MVLGNIIFTYILALLFSLLVEIPISQVFESTLNYLLPNISNETKEEYKEKDKPKQGKDGSASIELPICKEKL